MIRLMIFIISIFSGSAYGSFEFRDPDVSVVSLDGKMLLQIYHFFPATGDRQANISFYGCSEGVKNYQIEYKPLSEFELIECTLNSAEDIYVDLSYVPAYSTNNVLSYKAQDNKIGQLFFITQVERKTENLFFAALYLTEENRDGIFTVHTVDKHGACSTEEIFFSIKAGHSLFFEKQLKEGDVIKEVIVNGTKLEVEYDRNGFK